MEKGQPIWLKSPVSHWGWLPALVHDKEEAVIKDIPVLRVTLRDDPRYNNDDPSVPVSSNIFRDDVPRKREIKSNARGEIEPFEITLTIDVESFSRDELENIKIRDDSASNVGSVDDLIGLTHLHEPAILHALRVRYEEDVIYTSTGPILIAINPFKPMALYSEEVMEKYRRQGEGMLSPGGSAEKNGETNAERRLPPHAYLTADDAYRAMMRGIEIGASTGGNARKKTKRDNDENETPINQSILVSGESGAGKTVTTKIVLNYFAMLSKLVAAHETSTASSTTSRVEQQVLDSNPILESFGNARTIRNDNSSRFGKYIDIRFSSTGRLTGARIDTYLLEKVRLIRQTEGERNFHVFYQLLEAATEEERDRLFLGEMQLEDFRLVNQSGTYDRRDMVEDKDMHREMLEAMVRTWLFLYAFLCLFF
jgi:myosin-5